jgi:hypothetical protein
MKLFDKKAEIKVWIALIASIPFIFFVLWNRNGTIGKAEIIIASTTFLIGVSILYFVKWHSNKN